jgi:hypothetical protein
MRFVVVAPLIVLALLLAFGQPHTPPAATPVAVMPSADANPPAASQVALPPCGSQTTFPAATPVAEECCDDGDYESPDDGPVPSINPATIAAAKPKPAAAVGTWNPRNTWDAKMGVWVSADRHWFIPPLGNQWEPYEAGSGHFENRKVRCTQAGCEYETIWIPDPTPTPQRLPAAPALTAAKRPVQGPQRGQWHSSPGIIGRATFAPQRRGLFR